jgi:hypothetical protein
LLAAEQLRGQTSAQFARRKTSIHQTENDRIDHGLHQGLRCGRNDLGELTIIDIAITVASCTEKCGCGLAVAAFRPATP